MVYPYIEFFMNITLVLEVLPLSWLCINKFSNTLIRFWASFEVFTKGLSTYNKSMITTVPMVTSFVPSCFSNHWSCVPIHQCLNLTEQVRVNILITYLTPMVLEKNRNFVSHKHMTYHLSIDSRNCKNTFTWYIESFHSSPNILTKAP